MRWWLPLFVTFSGIVLAQQDTELRKKDPLKAAVESVSADHIRRYLDYLASDDLEGRLAGYPGNVKAARYIARHLEKIGLKPLGDPDEDGRRTYFQKFKHTKGRETQNIIGYVEGTDPDLKHEVVVVGAHMDHVGKAGQRGPGKVGGPKGDDDIWNGADDNGSGTATVMEVARAFMEAGIKTKRSVIFVWFSAEEWGLLGSAYYVNHTPKEFPIEDHVAMINLDMVGRNPNRPCSVSGGGTWSGWRTLLEKADDGIGADFRLSSEVGGGSDHVSFARKGVPCLHFFTGFHSDYHRVSDHVDRIAFDRAAKIAQAIVRLTAYVANVKDRPEYQGRKFLGINGEAIRGPRAKELGLGDGEGGFEVSSVSRGSVADKAGLQVGDVIVRFNGEALPLDGTLDALRRAIQKAPRHTAVPMEVLRNGERMKLTAVWGRLKKKAGAEDAGRQAEQKRPVEY